MKPQERFFFMYVLCWCEYRQYYSNGILYKVAENFSKVFAIPEKQLWYYVESGAEKDFGITAFLLLAAGLSGRN